MHAALKGVRPVVLALIARPSLHWEVLSSFPAVRIPPSTGPVLVIAAVSAPLLSKLRLNPIILVLEGGTRRNIPALTYSS
jgi:hypothetical protein